MQISHRGEKVTLELQTARTLHPGAELGLALKSVVSATCSSHSRLDPYTLARIQEGRNTPGPQLQFLTCRKSLSCISNPLWNLWLELCLLRVSCQVCLLSPLSLFHILG